MSRLPDGWKEVSLGDVADFINGRGFKPHEWSDKGLPIIRIQNLNGSNEFNYFDGEYHPKILIQRGDLLFAWSGSRGTSFGPHFWWGDDALLNYHTWKVTHNERITRDFLYYALKELTVRIEHEAHGAAALVHTRKDRIVYYTILLPPLAEQRRIAQILSTWDEAIALVEALIAALKRRKQGLMQRLLTGEVRFPGFEGEWHEVKLGDIGTTYTGLTGKNKEHFGAGKSYIPYKNIFDNSAIDPTRLDKVIIEDGERQNRVQYGDAFFTTSSETSDEVGMSAVLLDDVGECYLNSFCFGYRPHDLGKVIPGYLRYVLRSGGFRRQMYELAQGSTRYNISKTEVMKISIPLPQAEEQKRIASAFDTVEALIYGLQSYASNLREQKRGLMQRLLTGEVRVRTTEEG